MNKAMVATEAAKAVGLENLGSTVTVDARTAMGRQMTRDGIAPASDFMNMNDGATCRGQHYRVNESGF
ncbi:MULTISPECIES: hypothetical protein [Bradyrhizobium]|uniref:hypothetical protein n=1 Tax=Bradyrhizobium TaxID=374 RepID=UPI000429F125|nr:MULTISPECIES: hypothetical protein [Bradyrhizobium]QOG22814.1 hypothetical protein FOM02_41650 [Bradyrhizobium sp. SEMIA]UFW53402.1 hypothetical protein BaraCB756_21240 [Bradyrhizobium arachidis]